MDQYLIHQQILLVLSSKFIRIWLLLTTGSALTFVTSACLDSHSNLLLKRWLPSMSLLINLLQKRAFWNTKSCLSSEIHFSFSSLLYSWDLLCLAHREYTKKCLCNERNIKEYIYVFIYTHTFDAWRYSKNNKLAPLGDKYKGEAQRMPRILNFF